MGTAITRDYEEMRGCHVELENQDSSLYLREKVGYNPSSLGTAEATAAALEVTPKTDKGHVHSARNSLHTLTK
jgi:hypothetical protein